jgi:hypothetical protein
MMRSAQEPKAALFLRRSSACPRRPARTASQSAVQFLDFGSDRQFTRAIGKGLYASSYAHVVCGLI